MAGYLKEPVVLQWDMKTGSYGKIVQHIIEKKVCELDPIKIRYINPKDVDDFSTIDRIKKQILVQCSQIEMDFFEITEEQIEKLNIDQTFQYFLKFDSFNLEISMYSKLKFLLQKIEDLNVIVYITDKNFYQSVELIKWIYNENSNISFYIYPDKKKENFLVHVPKLHNAILEIISLCKVYKNIKLSIYDKEKIIKDILPLNYHRHGNFCITETGTVALYDFLPDYEYGLITTDKTIKEIWRDILIEHGDSDLCKILEEQRYWFKKRNGNGDQL